MQYIKKIGRGNFKTAFQNKSVDEIIYNFMEKENIPGLSLAIVQAPYIPRIVGYGVTDIEKNKLVSTRTIWPIGLISQGFTAVATIQLYEKNDLDIYSPISFYLQNIPNHWKNITILELLQHSSGIADYQKNPIFKIDKEYTSEELLNSITNLSLEFTPGTQVKQSATNFLLLTEIIEKVSGMLYYDFITEYQIKPLNLKNVYFSKNLNEIHQENLNLSKGEHELFKKDANYIDPFETPSGYRETEDSFDKIENLNSTAGKGFCDIWTTTENISIWDIGLAGSILIKEEKNRDLLYRPSNLSSGELVPGMAGWQFYAHKGLMDIKGSIPGYSTFLSRFTDKTELVCVTLTANKENVDLTELARRIAGAFDNNLAKINDPEIFYTYESSFDIKTTIERVENILKKLNIPIFAKFDHSENAKNVGLSMRETTVIVFGSPKVGTLLMLENQTIALELPLKILVYKDSDGSVWLQFKKIENLAIEYNLTSNKIVKKMDQLLKNIIKEAANLY